MNRTKKELNDQVTENTVEIEVLQNRTMRHEQFNAAAVESFDKCEVVLNKMKNQIRWLSSCAIVLTFIASGLMVALIRNKGEILEIRKTMNEG